jgi:hypothetical protein
LHDLKKEYRLPIRRGRRYLGGGRSRR